MTKLALITGGSRGLGKSIALHLAEKGCDILITYKNSQKEAYSVVSAIQELGQKGLALQLDVTEPSSFHEFSSSIKRSIKNKWSRTNFDFLINNAGMGLSKNFTDTTEQELDLLFTAHVKGPFLLTQYLLPCIKDGGRILNISSGLTRFSLPGYSAYAAMKGAMEVMTSYMAKELGHRRIVVNILAPGAIETDFNGGLVRDDEEINKQIASITALGRVGQADDIGHAAAALLVADSGWINGQRIEASGGMHL